MIALTIQCPSCGLQLHHAGEVLTRIEGRCGATRCPRCRDRLYFDATGDSLVISFPDLYLEPEAEFPALVHTETERPPVVHEKAKASTAQIHRTAQIRNETTPPTFEEEERHSHIVAKRDSAPMPELPREALTYTPLPSDLIPTINEEGDVIFPLLHSRRHLRRG